MRRRKRLRKKLHKLYLADLRYELSMSSKWRERLFAGEASFPVAIEPHEVLDSTLTSAMRRFGLRFVVQTKPQHRAPDWGTDWHRPDPNVVVFRFAAAEFPEIESYSWNNPAVV